MNSKIGKKYEMYTVEEKLFPQEMSKRLNNYYSNSAEILREFSIKYQSKHPSQATDITGYVLELSNEVKTRDRFLSLYYPLVRDNK